LSEIDQQFIEYVVKSLVGKPDAVKVDRRIDEKGVLLELTVDPEDLGRVIGKRGATAQSLRTLLRALGTKNDARYNLKIIDNGSPAPGRTATTTDDDAAKTAANDDRAAPSSDSDSAAENETPAAASEEETSAPSEAGEETSDRIRQAREELADLDDLDV